VADRAVIVVLGYMSIMFTGAIAYGMAGGTLVVRLHNGTASRHSGHMTGGAVYVPVVGVIVML
jgi:hypothetical protein